MQFLFQYDLNKPENLEESLKQFWIRSRRRRLLKTKDARVGAKRWSRSANERRGGDAFVRGAPDSRDAGEVNGD